MDKLGMHALLGVGRGSIEKSYLVVMKWNGSPNSKKILHMLVKVLF